MDSEKLGGGGVVTVDMVHLHARTHHVLPPSF